MPINTEKLGPGTLELGSGALAVSLQITGAELVASEVVDTEDGVTVLTGDKLAETTSETFRWVFTFTALQDLIAAHIVAWSWANRGTEQDVSYAPNDGGASFEFTAKPVPLTVGGTEVGKRMTATTTWRVVGDPTPTWAPA